MGITSILSIFDNISILKELSSHGKTFRNNNNNSILSSLSSSSLSSSNSSSLSLNQSIFNYILKKEVGKKNFLHFYIFGICWSIFLVLLFFTTLSSSTISITATINKADFIILFLLILIHLFRRCYECLYIHMYTKDSSKMYLAGYMLG